MKRQVSVGVYLILSVLLMACSRQSTDVPPATTAYTDTELAAERSRFLLQDEPQGASGVIDVRADASDQDSVVIVGRIGGSANPWVEGRAAFSIVDLSLKSCLECGSMDCPKPWDYC